MKALLKQLKKPRYADVDVLCLPRDAKVRASRLGKVLPQRRWTSMTAGNLHPKDADLLAVARDLPRLQSLRIDMWTATSLGVRRANLRVADDGITHNYIDGTLRVIATSPALARLSLDGAAGGCSYYRQGQDRCTAAGITALLDGVGSTLVRLDIYKKGNVARRAPPSPSGSSAARCHARKMK